MHNFVRTVPILVVGAFLLRAGIALEATPAQTLPSGREVIIRYVAAIGGSSAWTKLSSIRAKGTIELPDGTTGTFEVLNGRPARTVTRAVITGIGTIEEGYDGKVGWSIAPDGARLLTGRKLQQIADEARFDGRLRETGFVKEATTVERATFDKRPAYKLRVVYASGNQQTEYFDSETGLLLGWEGTRDLGGSFGVVPVVATMRDYKPFGNVKQPTVLLQNSIGLLQTFRMATVEFDVVPESAFDLPAPIKALVR
jgi:hypothetical protein